ncbi:hypothetical protein WR25_23918 [Diploscapter pachys]|uniref:BHLH domain-containing protein n=1 Tax=Diploscapter pachys TaxID=2018661 RepID=A0A2A2J9S0_9BILA|nr:hypothetical protein WR25_23918 [Diploscapter pachys]
MLPQLASTSMPVYEHEYKPSALVQHLRAPAMQPLSGMMSPPLVHSHAGMNFKQDPANQPTYDNLEARDAIGPIVQQPGDIEYHHRQQVSPCPTYGKTLYQQQPIDVTPTHHPGPSTSKQSNTKEELLRLLVNMSPSELEKLKNRRESAAKEKASTSAAGSGSVATATAAQPKPSAVAMRMTRLPRAEAVLQQKSDEEPDGNEDLEDDDEEDMQEAAQDASSAPLTAKRGPRGERRTAHNLIEKKYRCSINDRIQHLKLLLAGEEAKMSKSATLRLAIDHIAEIEAENSKLKEEVVNLRALLEYHQIEVTPNSPSLASPLANCHLSSPRVQSPDRNPSIAVKMEPGTRPAKRPRSGTMDHSRVTMFALMFAVMIWNPLSLISIGGTNAASSTMEKIPSHGRVLGENEIIFESYDSNDEWWNQSVIKPCFIWSINLFVACCVLIRLLVYGEPVQDFKSTSWTNFVVTRERAKKEVVQGNLREAQRQYVECLQILERPLPSSSLDLGLSLVWQIIRHTLNSLWVGRWFARMRRDSLKTVNVVCKSHAHTALLYHNMHQLHLLGYDTSEHRDRDVQPNGLYLALSAVNLAESAGVSNDGLTSAIMVQIYVGAALRCRLCLPSYLARMCSSYFYRRARRHFRRAPENTVSALHWIFHPAAKRSLKDPATLNRILTAKQPMKLDPFAVEDQTTALGRLRGAFKIDLLTLLVRELSGEDTEIDVVDVCHLLVTMCTKNTADVTNDKSDTAKYMTSSSIEVGDAACTWWTHLLACAIYWRMDSSVKAKKHYSIIRQCPPQLLQDPLALSVGHALCSRKVCLDDRNTVNFEKFVYLHARKALETLRLFTSRNAPHEVQFIQDGIRRMAYEWVMCSILDAWRVSLNPSVAYWTQPHNTNPLAFNVLYQEACNHYTLIHGHSSGNRLAVYQLTSRMLNGANPLETFAGVRRVKKARMEAVSGRSQMDRTQQPDAFHLHVLDKLHTRLGEKLIDL